MMSMNDDDLSDMIRRHATRHGASEHLRAGVRTQIALQAAASQPGPSARRRWWPGTSSSSRSFGVYTALGGFMAGAVLTLALVLFVPRLMQHNSLPAELLADHLRSLKVGPLYTVASSDRHTVKPWFQGRLDFAPQVPDLSGQGFALLGGRVEPVAGTPAAALVYEHGHHLINAFVWPADGPQAPRAEQIRGFNLLHWSNGSMQVWLVSDIEAGELERLRQAWPAP